MVSSQSELKKSFKIQGKGFFLTWPQCPVSKQVCADMLSSKGVIVKGLIGQETHADGNKHLHAYVKYIKELQTRNFKYFDIVHEGEVYHGNYQTAKCAIASIKYISKEDKEPLELGDMDWQQESSAKQAKKKVLGKRLASGESVADVIKDGNEELIFEYSKLVTNQKQYLVDSKPKVKDLDACCGVWVLGPPGVGKSHYVRHQCGHLESEILNKNCNKWFNDWNPMVHKVVLLDDFDKTHSNLGHYVKTWADKYAFQAEIKGGSMEAIRPEKVYVTSNYTPAQIWPDDPVLCSAIEDRFRVVDARAWEVKRDTTNSDLWQQIKSESKPQDNWQANRVADRKLIDVQTDIYKAIRNLISQ